MHGLRLSDEGHTSGRRVAVVADALLELHRGDGLGHEVDGAVPHGLHGRIHRAVGGHDDGVDGRGAGAGGTHHREAVDRLHPQVGEHQLGGLVAFHDGDGGATIVLDVHLVAVAAQEHRGGQGGGLVVINNENAQGDVVHGGEGRWRSAAVATWGSSAMKRAPPR